MSSPALYSLDPFAAPGDRQKALRQDGGRGMASTYWKQQDWQGSRGHVYKTNKKKETQGYRVFSECLKISTLPPFFLILGGFENFNFSSYALGILVAVPPSKVPVKSTGSRCHVGLHLNRMKGYRSHVSPPKSSSFQGSKSLVETIKKQEKSKKTV